MNTLKTVIIYMFFVLLAADKASIATEMELSVLSPPSKFSDIRSREFEESACLYANLQIFLKNVSSLNMDSFRSLGSVRKKIDLPTGQSGICVIFFDEMRECEIKSRVAYIGDGQYFTRALINENRYYCFILRDPRQGIRTVCVISDYMFSNMLRKGALKIKSHPHKN